MSSSESTVPPHANTGEDAGAAAAPVERAGLPAGPSAQAARGRTWDVLVVGGGLGGLTVASLLAHAGRAVLLLEASDHLGGPCRRVTQGGHPYDLGVSLVTGAGSGEAIAALHDRLGLGISAVPCEPAMQVALARHRVDLPAGTDGWWSEIQREFPEDEEGWHALVTDLAELARHREELARQVSPWPPGGWWDRFRRRRILTRRRWAGSTRQVTRELEQAAATPFQDALAEYGLGAASRQVLEACVWYLLVREANECSTLEAALALQRLREGVHALPGGADALAESLACRLRERGGEVRLRTEVARCMCARRRIAGVTTATGETIRARWIVTDLPPNARMGELVLTDRGWSRRRAALGQPNRVAQMLALTIPDAVMPETLGRHCLLVGDAGRPARDENLVFVRRASAEREEGPRDGLARLTVGRFVPGTVPEDARTVAQALLGALDRVIPGVGAAAVHQLVLSSTELGVLWGRPAAAVRFAVETGEWLGRRGLRHESAWPNLYAVGEWTYPGRSVSDVLEGAIHVADAIAAAPA